jgi:hypothetical protein
MKEDSNSKAETVVIYLALLLGLAMIIIGVLLTKAGSSSGGTICLSIGTSILASGLFSFIMLKAGLTDLTKNANALASALGEELNMPCVHRFRLTSSASKIGLTNVYLNREEALRVENFLQYIEKEKKRIFIIGSSLLGLIQEKDFENMQKVLENKIKHENIDIIFMLTHPLFADFRALQEGRNTGEIGKEIIESLKYLESKSKNSKAKVSIYLYKGTPTCFGIMTSEKMLVNPYPYAIKASKSPCYEFEHNSKAYGFYQDNHFKIDLLTKTERIGIDAKSIDELSRNINYFSNKAKEFENITKVENTASTIEVSQQ